VPLTFDTPRYGPDAYRFTDTGQAGTSNSCYFEFLGNQDILACGATECYQLDQSTGIVTVFDFTGAKLRTWGSIGQLVYGIAVDDVTGVIVATYSGNAVATFKPDGTGAPISGFTNTQLPMAVSATGGYAVFTRDLSGDIAAFPLNQGLVTTLATVPVGNTPMFGATVKVGSQVTTMALNVGDGTLSIVPVPQLTPVQVVVLPGLTTIANLPNIFSGSWRVKAFSSGPLAGTVAVLSRFDKSVWFKNISTGAVTGPFVVTSAASDDPMNIAPDNAHGTLIVALADATGLSGGTRFVKVDPTTGAVSQPLQSASSLLAVGLAVSPDGSTLLSCGGKTCEAKPNN
jgi:hypothetical protein